MVDSPTLRSYFPLGLVAGEFRDAGRHLVLSRDLYYFDPDFHRDVRVPAGFETDFNSVPRGLWNFFPPWEYPEAGVVHDWLYQHPMGLARGDVDDTHRHIMLLEGASGFMARSAWLGIRAGGWKPWGSYRAAGLR